MDDQLQGPPPESQSGTEPAKSVPTIVLTQQALGFLDQTRPWVRFLSIMVFIGAAFMALAAVAMIALAMAGAISRSVASNPLGAAGVVAAAFFYLMVACLYIAPGIFLYRYASAIRRLKNTCASEALEDALKQQKSLWRFVGILTVIGLVIMVVVLVIAVLAGILGVMLAGRR